MSRTLIEFYDKSPLENVVSSLVMHPRKVIFLGSNPKQMEREIANYQRVWRKKGIDTETECYFIQKNDLDQIQETLSVIIDQNPDCMVDLTGGDELSLVAVGMGAITLKDRNISFHRVNVNTRKLIDYFGTDLDKDVCEPTLTVEENIALHGGMIVYDTEKPGATHLWNWNQDFISDVNKLWEIVRLDCGAWNTQMKQLESVIKPGDTSVFCHIGYQDMYGKSIKLWNHRLFIEMQRQRLIANFTHDKETFSFTIKNKQLSRVLSKAGTILELKTYLIAKDLPGKNHPHFSNVMTSVYIDWDGEIHQRGEDVKDTENEIDVLCMKGLIPLFISCKNGAVAEDELYKLNTVAQRFGGDYAKKVLITTYIDKSPHALEYFRQRAADMGIMLIEGVDSKTDKKFSSELKNVIP